MALKVQVAAYKKATEDTVKAVVVVAEDSPAGPSKLIKLDSDNKNNNNGDAYAIFKDINNIKAIRVEYKEDFILN